MDVYEIVQSKILDLLDEGTVPWKKPWGTLGLQRNYETKREYTGFNQFYLNCMGYMSPYWLTYNQAKKIGKERVKETGDRSQIKVIKPEELSNYSIAIFFKMIEKRNRNRDEEPEKIPLLRYYKLYNTDQTVLDVDLELFKHNHDPIEECEHIIQSYPNSPILLRNGYSAYYRPDNDSISIPHINQFHSAEEYYSTLFHECIHSTGHKDRLSRELKGFAMDKESYSKEELIAEMGASFLCGIVGIEDKTIENSASYIDAWRKRISEDKRLVISAAGEAQKAVNYITNNNDGQDDE